MQFRCDYIHYYLCLVLIFAYCAYCAYCALGWLFDLSLKRLGLVVSVLCLSGKNFSHWSRSCIASIAKCCFAGPHANDRGPWPQPVACAKWIRWFWKESLYQRLSAWQDRNQDSSEVKNWASHSMLWCWSPGKAWDWWDVAWNELGTHAQTHRYTLHWVYQFVYFFMIEHLRYCRLFWYWIWLWISRKYVES